MLGVGRIGKEVIKRGVAFRDELHRIRQLLGREFCQAVQRRGASPRPDEVLKFADIVSLHMNLSPETQGFINKERLAMMKDGAIVINTARGGLVVESDIAEACRSGKLKNGGYGADVLEQEPPKGAASVSAIGQCDHYAARRQPDL